MLDVILEKFSDITKKCLDKHSKEFGVAKQDVQLVFKLDASDDVQYLMKKNFKTEKVLTFLQVLGVKLDFKGYSLFVPKFIKGALERLAKENSIDLDKVFVLLRYNKKDQLVLWLYNYGNPVRQIELTSLFDSSDIMEE